MKYLLIILIMLVNFCLYAQNKPYKENSQNTTKKIVQETKKNDLYSRLKKESTLKNNENALSLEFPVFKLIVSFVLLFGVLGGVIYALKRWGKRFTGLENNATIKVVSRSHLDGKNYLVVVRVYEEEMLLGVGNNGINLLSRFSPIGEDEIEANNNDGNNSVFDTELKNVLSNPVVSEDIKGS